MIVNDIAEWRGLLSELQLKDRVSLDLETTGLKPAEGDKICMVVLYHPDTGSRVTCFRMHGFAPNLPVELIKDLQTLIDLNVELVGHNIGPFDLNFLRAEGVDVRKARVFDTLLATLLWNDSLPRYALKWLGVNVLGDPQADHHQRAIWTWQEKAKTKDFSRIPLELAEPYAAGDGDLAWRLREFVEPKILERGDPYPELLRKDMRWAKFLADLGWNGLGFDRDEAEKLLQFARKRMYEIEEEYRKEWSPKINLGSPVQVKAMIAGRHKYHLPDTEDWVMRMAVKEHPEMEHDVEQVLEYRRWAKMSSSWLTKWMESYQKGNGRVRGSWGIDAANEAKRASAFTRTLRLRCSKPNLQAVPTDDEFGHYRLRHLFKADGNAILVGYDCSQIEVRLAAHYAQEETMLDELRKEKGDIHQRVADDLKLIRYRAKRLNLGTIYGIGGAALSHQITMETLTMVTEQEARRWLRRYESRYPKLKSAMRKAERVIQQRGYLYLWNGRRAHFNPELDEPHKAFNLLIQTGVSELIKDAILRVLDFIETRGLKTRIVLQVHDEIITEVPPEEVRYAGDIQRLIESVGPPDGWRCPTPVKIWKQKRWSEERMALCPT